MGFLSLSDITMFETLMRPHQVDVVPPLPTVSSIATQLKDMEARREAKRLRQIANSRSRVVGDKRKREDIEGAEEDSEDQTQTRHADQVDGSGKRVKTEFSSGSGGREDAGVVVVADANASESVQVTASMASGLASVPENGPEAPPAESPSVSKVSVSKAFPEVRGHTSYLTFAILFPPPVTPPETPAPANTEAATAETTPDNVAPIQTSS